VRETKAGTGIARGDQCHRAGPVMGAWLRGPGARQSRGRAGGGV